MDDIEQKQLSDMLKKLVNDFKRPEKFRKVNNLFYFDDLSCYKRQFKIFLRRMNKYEPIYGELTGDEFKDIITKEWLNRKLKRKIKVNGENKGVNKI